jgi:hypothetical protein
VPGLACVAASVSAAPTETGYARAVLDAFTPFPALRSLDLSFADSLELNNDDVTALADLSALTSLRLSNISLPATTDCGRLSSLTALRELGLVHNSKVSALMVGDAHLRVLGTLTGLQQLALQGRMCSATDDGLLALSGLSRLSALAISWVPWQSQISQRAALQLLGSLRMLTSLQLGGAELLLPSTPYSGSGGGSAAPLPPQLAEFGAAAGNGGVTIPPGVLGIGLAGGGGQGHSLVAAAVAAVSRADSSRSGGGTGPLASLGLGGHHGEHMRSVLSSKATSLSVFKLQFNCCGTGVEKVCVLAAPPAGASAALICNCAHQLHTMNRVQTPLSQPAPALSVRRRCSRLVTCAAH